MYVYVDFKNFLQYQIFNTNLPTDRFTPAKVFLSPIFFYITFPTLKMFSNIKYFPLIFQLKGVVRWYLKGPVSSDYLAHCSHPFFMSIRIEFLARYSMLSQNLVTRTLLARLFFKPWVLSVSSETLMPITPILILAVNCVFLLHQIVMGRLPYV